MITKNSFPFLFLKLNFNFINLSTFLSLFINAYFFSPPLLRASLDPIDYVSWDLVDEKRIGSDFQIEIELTANAPFRVYEDKLQYIATPPAKILTVEKPNTNFFKDPLTGLPTKVFTQGRFRFLVSGNENDSPPELILQYVACTEDICSRPIQVVYKNSSIKSGLVQPGKEIESELETINPDSEDKQASKSIDPQSIEKPWTIAFLGMIFLAGLATNLTPCVYPMIPITLRVMAIPGSNPFVSAFSYASGIVLTYTSLGVIAASSGSLFGSFIASPTFSLSFALLMAFFAFSMLGFGDLSFLQNIGSRFGSGKPGPLNTFAMGAGAGLVAAPCTGPILAALIAWIAKGGNTQAGSVLLFVYSVGFAIPYLLLGGFAKNASRIKISPGIQIFTKYCFAAVMFTLSAYYARIPFYKYLNSIQSFFPVIAFALCLIGCFSFLFGFLRNNTPTQKKYLYSLSSLFFGLSLFFVWQFTFSKPSQINWHKDEKEAFSQAKFEGKPVFIDAWAEWCEACKKMDVTTLLDPSVVSELNENWISLKLDLTENTEANEIIYSKYGIQTLPSYVFISSQQVDAALNSKLENYQIYNGYLEAEELLLQLNSVKTTSQPSGNK